MNCSLRFAALLILVLSGVIHAEEQAGDPVVPPGLDAQVRKLVDRANDSNGVISDSAAVSLRMLPRAGVPLLAAELQREGLRPASRELLAEIHRRLAAAYAHHDSEHANDAAWARATSVEAYQAVGRRNARWDEPVLKGMALFFKQYRSDAELREAVRLLDEAIGAGCDDPLTLYAHARGLQIQENVIDRATFRRAAESILQSEYPATRKLFAILYHVNLSAAGATDEEKRSLHTMLAAAIDLLPAAAQEERVPRAKMSSLTWDLVKGYELLYGSRRQAIEEKLPQIEAALPGSAVPLNIRGEWLIKYAWEARGSGWASTVTD